MATWEDGPEYAPTAAPTEFVSPDVDPLEQAPPPAAIPDTPAYAPADYSPATDTASPPLSDLGASVTDHTRNPVLPFEVYSSALTEHSSRWEAEHQAATPALRQWAPPTTGDLSAPMGSVRDPHRPFTVGAAPHRQAPTDESSLPAGPPRSLRDVADYVHFLVGWPLVVCLLLSLIPVLSPVTLTAFVILTQLVDESVAKLRKVAISALGFIAGICVLSVLATDQWWAIAGKWSVLVAVLLIFYTIFLISQAIKTTSGNPRR